MTRFLYSYFDNHLFDEETFQKNLIESFVSNILLEYLFNNENINNEEETNIFNYLYISNNGYLSFIKKNNHYLSTDNSNITKIFKLNNELFQLLTDGDTLSDSFKFYVDLIIYYISEIKKYFHVFQNYINVLLNNDEIRPLNWSNRSKDWIIYSMEERFFMNKTDNDISYKLKKDINEIHSNNNVNKFKIFFNSFKKNFIHSKFPK